MKQEELPKAEHELKSEETIFQLSQEELEEIRQKAIREAQKKKHKWRQKGVWLVCESCKHKHGYYIGLKKIMVGEDEEGNPILRDREEVFKKASSLSLKTGVRTTKRKLV